MTTTKRRFDAVIFDMDGLLIDSEVLWQKVEGDLLSGYGHTFNLEIAQKHLGMRIDQAAAVMVREYGLEDDPVAFANRIVDALLDEFRHSLQLMPGADALLQQVGRLGLPVAIASSSPSRVVLHVVEQMDWSDVIPILCAGDEVTQGKPAPDVFLLAAERLGVSPARCLVFEDSLNGARAAQAAGMYCVAVPNPLYDPALFQGIANLIISSLEETSLEDLLFNPPGINQSTIDAAVRERMAAPRTDRGAA